ncbi:MAG TPA: zinc-dependent alcohol dehydrogenase family protein [Acidobacteriota bacterium]|nr:zinc-dependent alcohol dehydrogenase family protein [Acidobacteriota bacterium]
MKAMILESAGVPLQLVDCPVPEPGANEVLLKVHACGVCRTDLHIVDGELKEPKPRLIPGHEIVGTVTASGSEVADFHIGDRVGVPWLGATCGTCFYCNSGRENLCDRPVFTGYTRDGGYAGYAVADARFCFPIPSGFSDFEAAPLLCAGLIGYRSYRLAGPAKTLGIYGFGGAAHIITQIAVHEGRKVYAFTKPGDTAGQAFAKRLGATWAGSSEQMPPVALEAAIIFAPVGGLVPLALQATAKGGIVVCGGIHMSDIPSFPYRLLWEERVIRSVANLTREDGKLLLEAASRVPVKTSIELFRLEQANEALDRLRSGKIEGAAVLAMDFDS